MTAETVKATKTAQDALEAMRTTILVESIKREQRFYRPYTSYTVTPSLKKNFFISSKPTSSGATKTEKEDAEYMLLEKRLTTMPRDKFPSPQTSAQEIGWDTTPLVTPVLDPRFHHPKLTTDITKLYGAVLKSKDKNGGLTPASTAASK